MKKRLLLVLPFLAITACGGKKDEPKSDVTVTLSQTSLDLSVSDVTNLVATVTGSEESVNWTTSDNSVASVSAGNVTALGVGTCEIYATVSKVTATCYVTVNAEDTNVYDIEGPSSYNLAMNQKQDIVTTVYCYEGENKTKVDVAVDYKSSDEKINFNYRIVSGLHFVARAGHAALQKSCKGTEFKKIPRPRLCLRRGAESRQLH